ncbi:MAG: ATP-binding protein [Thermodesulfovibrionales bacterium]|nr:ATP-binding protein [Thermodesulfovibrionales bacterium]
MKKLKQIKAFFLIVLLVMILVLTQLYFLKLSNIDLTTKFILIGILSVNLIALLTLIFLVFKNLFKLYLERRDKILGYRFRSRLVIIFITLVFIPTGILYIGAVSLSTNYINNFFSIPLMDGLSNSVELARSFYDFERSKLLDAARQIAKGNNIQIDDIAFSRLNTIPPDATDTIKEAFEGKEGTEIISSYEGDIVRAAVPVLSRENVIKEILLAELRLPPSISERAERLRAFHEEILKLQSFKTPIKINFILVMGFITLMIVFSGLWISLKISQGITEPIQRLALATKKVAAGNLNVLVEAKTDDEVGMLIKSFNQMVKELRENKESLEKAYLESDRRRIFVQNILENINSGVVFFDTEMKIATINKAAGSILKIDTDNCIGLDYEEFINKFNSADLKSFVDSLKNKKIVNVRREIKLEIESEKKILSIYLSGIWDNYTKNFLGLLVVFNDITTLVEAQNLIAKKELARNLAHEIKNPLTPIKLSTERLIKKWKEKKEDFDANFERLTSLIISQVDSLTQLADSFSKYGKMPEIVKSSVNVQRLIEEVVSLYTGVNDVEIKLTFEDDLPLASLDKEQMKRALINILDNAIKAVDAEGQINIDVKISNDFLIMEIADNGQGIGDAEKEKLFQPYFSRRKDGTGLGLAIAAKIIADHGGHISVRDNEPKGCIFTIKLPLI